jgi:hypothetical protein
MSRAASIQRVGAVLAVVFTAGWIGARVFVGEEQSRASPPAFAPQELSAAALDSATVSVRGQLTTASMARLAPVLGDESAVLVVLDSADVRVCEDLGRQLRVLHRRIGAALPLVVVTAPGALAGIRTFARREHLAPAAFVGIRSAELMVGNSGLPTPAAVVLRGGGSTVAGVAHPRRFRNVRIRSFADELSADLPGEPGGPSGP